MSNSKCPGQDVEKYSSFDFIFRTPGPETKYFKHLFFRSKNDTTEQKVISLYLKIVVSKYFRLWKVYARDVKSQSKKSPQ